jgi:beta-N-acetylhexosaminidase
VTTTARPRRSRRIPTLWNSLWRLAVCAGLLAWYMVGPIATAFSQQEDTPPVSPEVSQLMEQMTSLEKVGQLFLVTFVGSDVSARSDVARLIQQSRVGGVVLSPTNGNFVNNGRSPERLRDVVNGLQTLALTPPLTSSTALTAATYTPIPLWVALNQEGDEYPYSALWSGVTPLPSAMALGATWMPAYAEQTGEIVGRELAAAGVTMLLGPSLDVLDKPRPASPGSLGTRSFGGDPYWVSEFGRAYIRGVHKGGQGRLLTVAKHFPGLGGADRDPVEELPTIQKSLETLRSIELVPFFAVTALRPTDPLATTDALMTSHVRYRGFQGNIRQLSRPISLDAQNLPTILALPEFAPWRNRGGLLVSQELGTPSIRKFYDPTLQTFPAKRIAQEAFLAGNDLLLLSRFDLNDEWTTQLANVEATVLFFRDKYESDPTFKSRVDVSVARILQHKLAVYGTFTPDSVLLREPPAWDALRNAGYPVVAKIAQEAVTLIYPGVDELSSRLPGPPLSDERILIVTDDRRAQECAACVPFYLLPPRALEDLMLKLYGPEATGQISDDQVNSLTFHQLKRLLTVAPPRPITNAGPSPTATSVPDIPSETSGSSAEMTATLTAPPGLLASGTGTPRETVGLIPTVTTLASPHESPLATVAPPIVPASPTEVPVSPSPTPLATPEQELIRTADWIIFAMLDVNTAKYPDSDVVSLFLRERSDSLQGKKIVVLAFNAPYFLDATEVSKLTAYYGLYSRSTPFQEAAVRLLFQEFQPRGASPVDIDAIGYQIIEATRPDPNQVISIEVVTNGEVAAGTPSPTVTPKLSPEGTPIPIKLDLKVGDVLTLRTSRIVDRNGRPVPDGTPVEFRLLDTAQSLEARLPLANTVNGVATVNFNLDRSGTWQITATSDLAQRSVRLIVTIPEKGPVEVGIDRPTATATAVPTPTPPPAPSDTYTPPPTETPLPPPMTPTAPEATVAPQAITSTPARTVSALDLLLSLVSLTAVTIGSFRLSARRSVSAATRLKRALIGTAAGLIGYVLFAIGVVPIERIPFISQAVRIWLPYPVLPVVVCLLFFGLGWWLMGIPRVRRLGRSLFVGRSGWT